MTNEQIITDNVDVSGCEFYIDSKNLEFNCKQTPQSYFCKNQPNCYYKQLKREEQENKRLLEIINAKPLETVDIDSAFEIEKLKEQLQAKGQECEELKKTLIEIKELAEDHCVFCKKIDPETFDMSECKLCNHSKILQKISECEVE